MQLSDELKPSESDLQRELRSVRHRLNELEQVFQAHIQTLSTVEMVIFTLWKTNRLPSTSLPAKIIRLMGHGDEYFRVRKDWTIDNWIDHLQSLQEQDFPGSLSTINPVTSHHH